MPCRFVASICPVPSPNPRTISTDPSVNSSAIAPTVLCEAMWAGIPVVAGRLGDVERLFLDDRPGWLVEPGDEPGLERALLMPMDCELAPAVVGL